MNNLPLACSLLLTLGLGSLRADDEVVLTIDQVPAVVKEAILKAADGIAVEKIEQETKKGAVVYSAEWTDKDGVTEVEVTIAADGTVLKTEREAKDGEHDEKHEKHEKK